MQQAYFVFWWDITENELIGPYDTYEQALEHARDDEEKECSAVVGPINMTVVRTLGRLESNAA